MNASCARCVAFLRETAARNAAQIVPTAHGTALLSPQLPQVWYRNFLAVDVGTEATAEDLAAGADAVQGPIGLRHRKVTVYDDLGERVAASFRALGWKVEHLLVMVQRGGNVEPPPGTEEIRAEDLAPIWAEGIRGTRGVPDEETVNQLVTAQLGRQQGVDVRYFASAEDGAIASYCELFSRAPTGQIESVMTLEPVRGRGHGRAVITRALAESAAAGHDLTFLLADESDWPKELYRKLGFVEVGSIWDFILEPT